MAQQPKPRRSCLAPEPLPRRAPPPHPFTQKKNFQSCTSVTNIPPHSYLITTDPSTKTQQNVSKQNHPTNFKHKRTYSHDDGQSSSYLIPGQTLCMISHREKQNNCYRVELKHERSQNFKHPAVSKFKSGMPSPEKQQFLMKMYSPQRKQQSRVNLTGVGGEYYRSCEAVQDLVMRKQKGFAGNVMMISARRPSCNRSLSLRDFEIGRMLGKGKLGEVFLVRHYQTNFICAMKVIYKSYVKQHGLEQQVVQQIKIQSFLNHPNLVSLYGWFQDKQRVYLLLQPCLDGQLYSLIKDRRIAQSQARKITSQICLALQHMHGLNIIHRDLKPENIVMQYVVAKICDFGWAAVCNSVRNTVCGTPLYLSPELLTGHDYDERTDIWALGIMTYEMLMGQPPFNIRTHQHLNRILIHELTFPKQPSITPWAQDFIRKALAKDPGQRLLAGQLLSSAFLTFCEQQS